MPDYGPQGKIALWKADEGKSYVFQGSIELPPDVMQQIIESFDGDTVRLNVIGFNNNSENPKAPKYSGPVSLKQQPKQNPPASQSAIAGWDDSDEIPF